MPNLYGPICSILTYMHDKAYLEEGKEFKELAAYMRYKNVREVNPVYMYITAASLERRRSHATAAEIQQNTTAALNHALFVYPTDVGKFQQCANRGATMVLHHERYKLLSSEIKLTFLRGIYAHYRGDILQRGGERISLDEIVAMAEDVETAIHQNTKKAS